MDAPPAWLCQTATTVVWALGRLLADASFWVSLVATLLGVLIAFRLERWQEARHAREQYARTLNAVRYESAQLHAICVGALASIPQGAITSNEVDAPALRALVAGPMLHEHASHGVTVVLGSLLTFVGAASNSLDHYRRMVASAGYSLPLPGKQLAPLTKHLERLLKGIENAQGLMDAELQRLQRGVTRTDEDRKAIAAFTEATKDRPGALASRHPDTRGTQHGAGRGAWWPCKWSSRVRNLTAPLSASRLPGCATASRWP